MKKHGFKIFNFLILLVLFAFLFNQSRAQTCPPPKIEVFVLDEKGNPLDPSTLDEPKFSDSRLKTVFYTDAAEAKREAKILRFGSGCVAKLDSLTFRYRGKAMTVIFNVLLNTHSKIAPGKYNLLPGAHASFRLPPFQNGTFEFVPNGTVKIGSDDWKKISDRAETDRNKTEQ